MFEFDLPLLAQQRIFFFFFGKRGSSVYILPFSKLVKQADKNDAETMKSLNPFVKVFILFAQSGRIISWYPTKSSPIPNPPPPPPPPPPPQPAKKISTRSLDFSLAKTLEIHIW